MNVRQDTVKRATKVDLPDFIKPSLKRWVAYAACAWALLFAAAHYYWAFGGTWLLEAAQVSESQALLARRPLYYWGSWVTLSTTFILVGLFPLTLVHPRNGLLPHWLQCSVVWGAAAVLLLLAAALVASTAPPSAPLLFASCAAALVWTRLRHSTVPPWALHSATFLLGLGMILYGMFGLGRLSAWGAWWLLGGTLFVTAAWCNTNWSAARGQVTPSLSPASSKERVCVGALLLRTWGGSPRILLGKRAPDLAFYPGVWDVIGGHCEPGETPEQSLVRELQEEVGVTPTAWRPPETFRSTLTDRDEVLVLHLYVVTGWSGTPHNRAPDEHAEIAWLAVEDACRLPLSDPRCPALFRRLAAKAP